MANMFSGNREKQVPKNFKECYKTDSVTNNLWLWAERLENIGIVLAVIIGIATLITFVIIDINGYNDGGYILLGLCISPIAAFLEYITFHIIALLVGSLASIVQNTKISANVSLYKYALQNNEPLDEPIDNPLKKNQTTKKKYACSQCGNPVEIGEAKCEHCGKELDWSNVLNKKGILK